MVIVMPYRIIPYRPYLKELARKLRKNMTLGEVILWKHLKGKQMHGYDFDRQRPIDRFIVDFYCKELMLAIEIDGASHNSEAAQQRDAERQAQLESLGVRFLRFREGDVRDRPQQVLATIEAWVLQHRCRQSIQKTS
ncbi:MAG: endonuclease domain-containing protein [Leptolyngbyaceae cyanobacterium]